MDIYQAAERNGGIALGILNSEGGTGGQWPPSADELNRRGNIRELDRRNRRLAALAAVAARDTAPGPDIIGRATASLRQALRLEGPGLTHHAPDEVRAAVVLALGDLKKEH